MQLAISYSEVNVPIKKKNGWKAQMSLQTLIHTDDFTYNSLFLFV